MTTPAPVPAVPLAIIGGGHMGGALARGGVASGALDRGLLMVAEPDDARRAALAAAGIPACATAPDALGWLRVADRGSAEGQVLLAVKPQMLAAAAAELAPTMAGAPRIVISILAGTPSAKVRAALGDAARVVRAMPNLPVSVGLGVTAVARGAGAAEGDEAFAERLFGAVGEVIAIDEAMMDAFTGVAGSGPAYVFYLAEAMVEAAVGLGFDRSAALLMVRGTVTGAAALLAERAAEPGDLRAAVTSRGGTTAAAIGVLDAAGVGGHIAAAIRAARDRGAELGRS